MFIFVRVGKGTVFFSQGIVFFMGFFRKNRVSGEKPVLSHWEEKPKSFLQGVQLNSLLIYWI